MINKDILIYILLYIILYIFSKKFINYSIEYFSERKNETLEIEVIVKTTFNTLFKDNLKKEKIKNAYRVKNKLTRCEMLKNAANKSLEETVEIHNIFFDKLNKNYDNSNKIIDFFKIKNKKKIDEYIKTTSDDKCEHKNKNNKKYKLKNNIISNNLALILLPIVLESNN